MSNSKECKAISNLFRALTKHSKTVDFQKRLVNEAGKMRGESATMTVIGCF